MDEPLGSTGRPWSGPPVPLFLCFIALLFLVICLWPSALAAWAAPAAKVGGRHNQADKAAPQRTKSEARVIELFEKLTGCEFPTSYPPWLREDGKSLELDGYNKKLGVAIEFSGPLHTRWLKTESYAKYYGRLKRDVLKKILCYKNKVRLIVIDMSHNSAHLSDYIQSRLSDISICERPFNYVPPLDVEVYRSPAIEKEEGLSGLDHLISVAKSLGLN